MNRRLLALIVLAAALCFLASQAFADLPIFPNKTPRQMYFRIVTHGGDDPYWAVVHQGMLDACKELGIKADMDFCGGDLALQLKRFKEAMAMNCDGIGLVLNDDKVWDAPVAGGHGQGHPGGLPGHRRLRRDQGQSARCASSARTSAMPGA